MSNVIIFGLSDRPENVIATLQKRGMQPVCFCEWESKKHSDRLVKGLPLYYAREAAVKFPDAKVYVTFDEPKLYDEILKLIDIGIFEEHQFINEVRTKYTSCDYLEYGFGAFIDGVKNCCGEDATDFDNLPFIPYSEMLLKDTDTFIEQFFEMKEMLIAANKSGEKTSCTNCLYLREKYWSKQRKITILNLSLDHSCNLKCEYCYKHKDGYISKNSIDIIELIRKLKASKYVDLQDPIYYASGELCIQPNADEILEYLKEYDISIFTNATRYNKNLHNMIKKPKSCAVISLDAGTRDTYKKIKGVDAFQTVCENIKRYSEDGGHVILKYIVKEDNINKEDLDGFVEFCLQCNIKNIRISRDWYLSTTANMSLKIKSAAAKLAYKAMKHELNYYTNGTTICQEWN